MKKAFFISLALLAVLLLVVSCGKQPSTEEPSVGEETEVDTNSKPMRVPLVVEDIYTVEVTNSGFEPSDLTLKSGDSVRFVAMDNGRHWPASALHPLHQEYPGSSIGKCNGPEQDQIFDACRVLPEGQGFEFRFTEKGTWKYHDHLHPSLTGTITVE